MASNVVVIDTSARKVTIKVTPQTYMSDVLNQACTKFNRRPEQWGLKYNKKPVDLSLTYRFSALPAGAQLELVQSSRSPAVVNVALQFPQAENNLRLTEKFPSTTSLWQILRRFESGTAGGAPYPLNITERSIPQTSSGSSGSGRMMYEMPSLSFMNREFGSFVDLQKTLAQIGASSGSAMLRLNYKNSGKPLEEAMLEISQYFKDADGDSNNATSSGAHAVPPASITSSIDASPAPKPAAAAGSDNPPSPPDAMEDVTPIPQTVETPDTSSQPSSEPPKTQTPNIQVFSAPTSTPAALSVAHNDADYVPSIEQAKSHQASLETRGQNKRLLSDEELENQRKEREAKVKTITQISVQFRMPDQMRLQRTYGREDTAQSLFETMASVLRHPDVPYTLSFVDPSTGRQTSVPRSSTQKLIQGLHWTGNTLVNVSRGEGVPEKAREEPWLKDEYVARAKELKAEMPKAEPAEEEPKSGGFLGGILGKKTEGKKKSTLSAAEKESKMMKMMGFGKK